MDSLKDTIKNNFLFLLIIGIIVAWFFGYSVAYLQYNEKFDNKCEILRFGSSDNQRIYRVTSWDPQNGCFIEEEQKNAKQKFLEDIILKN